MEIETENAAEHFFQNPAFTQIYSEAVTNSLDAGASSVQIDIKIRSFAKPNTVRIVITDNGTGFTDDNFDRFSKLLKPRDGQHKGLGRLVYLRYFQQVDGNSFFAGKVRSFSFSRVFDGESTVVAAEETTEKKTVLTFKNFTGDKFKSYDDLRPQAIKEQLMIELLPRLYEIQKNQGLIKITISLETEVGNSAKDFMNDVQTITLDQLPKLREKTIKETEIDLFDEITMAFTIESGLGKDTVVTALCIDGRTIDLKLIPPGSIPGNHSAIFLFSSPFFIGKTDSSRQCLDFKNEIAERLLKRVLRRHVAAAIREEIPAVEEKNGATKKEFEQRFPHLLGYFEEETVGLIKRDEAIEIAQRRFFAEQKEILESDHLDDAQFQKSMDVSSRTLTEYILYRNLIVQKLREISSEDSEEDIHKLMVPRYKTFRGTEFMRGVYSNNAWLLDDKFMTFTTILSEARMDKLIGEITLAEDVTSDNGRPDISMIFSSDPSSNEKVDVVVVELKKQTDDEKENVYAINQLLQRAEKLAISCPNIQRIWYYAVVQINTALSKRLMQMKWSPLFSKGQVFYQEFPTEGPDGVIIPTPIFVLSFDAVINDAEARNSTFLKILREEMKSKTEGKTPKNDSAEDAIELPIASAIEAILMDGENASTEPVSQES